QRIASLALEGADIDSVAELAGEGRAALVELEVVRVGAVVDARAPGLQRVCSRRPAVIGQRTEEWVQAEQLLRDGVRAEVIRPSRAADQTVGRGDGGSAGVEIGIAAAGAVLGEDGALRCHAALGRPDAAAGGEVADAG